MEPPQDLTSALRAPGLMTQPGLEGLPENKWGGSWPHFWGRGMFQKAGAMAEKACLLGPAKSASLRGVPCSISLLPDLREQADDIQERQPLPAPCHKGLSRSKSAPQNGPRGSLANNAAHGAEAHILRQLKLLDAVPGCPQVCLLVWKKSAIL